MAAAGTLAAVALLSSPARAVADAGIPMLPVKSPQIVLFLIPVILIEAIYLANQLRSSFVRTLMAVSGMNALTMALGYPLAWLMYLWLDRMVGIPTTGLAIFTHAAWLPVWVCTRLMPEWGGIHQEIWPVLVTFLVLLLPSYIVSGLVKAWLVDLFDLLQRRGSSRHEVWIANRLSYLFLAATGCVLLYKLYSGA